MVAMDNGAETNELGFAMAAIIRRVLAHVPRASVPRPAFAGRFKLIGDRQVDSHKLCNTVFRARAAVLIYTAFTNLICNREITYGRDK